MKIEHIGLFVKDLEQSRTFYETYLNGQAGPLYEDPVKGFASYFINFAQGARLEIMAKRGIEKHHGEGEHQGWSHLAFSLGSREEVDQLTSRLKTAGYTIISGPRETGDGYYESLFLDPDENRVEITV